MDEFDFEFEDDEKSKSQVKRELLALKALGVELIALPIKDIEKLELSAELYDAVIEAKAMTHGALKRQTGYIGGLIANSDYEAIEQGLARLKQVHQGGVKQFHQLESWRDELLNNSSEVMTQLHQQFSDFDGQYVRQLVRNANKETAQNKPPKSARLLFKYLQQLQHDHE